MEGNNGKPLETGKGGKSHNRREEMNSNASH